jgi:hypothetical protein
LSHSSNVVRFFRRDELMRLIRVCAGILPCCSWATLLGTLVQ